MTNRPNERLPMAVTLGTLVALAQLACLVAIGFFAWRELFSPASPFGDYPDITTAVIFRGEVYFCVLDMKANGNRERVRAFDLKTGRARDVFTPQFLTNRGWVTDGKRLWGIGDREIIETDGTTVVTHRPQRLLNTPSVWPAAFLYEGHPAILDRDASDVERLLVLVDGEWEDKGEVALPGSNRVWAFDEQRGEKRLVPRTSGNSTATATAAGAWRWTKVVPAGGTYHLFQLDIFTTTRPASSHGVLYRQGFDFVSSWSEGDSVSALAPENSPTEATGWTKVETTGYPYCIGVAALGDDVILACGDGHVWKREGGEAARSPTFVKSVVLSGNLYGQVSLLSSPDSAELYVLNSSQTQGLYVFLYQQPSSTKLPYYEPLLSQRLYRVEGFEVWMVRLWGRVLLKVMGVIAVGTLMLVAVGSRQLSLSEEMSHSFGLTTVQLAPLGRRCMAKGVDLALLFTPFVILLAWLVAYMDSESLYFTGLAASYGSLPSFGFEYALLFITLSHWTVPLFLIFTRYEGRYGVTPGKWLCGLRTLRTTLRPCGFARALLRELLMWFDTPLLLTVIPGVMCLLCSDRRQRIGDLIADTIVVEHGGAKAA